MEILEKCRVCGHNVAKGASVCPNCGAKYPTKKGLSFFFSRHPLIATVILFFIIAFTMSISVYFGLI